MTVAAENDTIHNKLPQIYGKGRLVSRMKQKYMLLTLVMILLVTIFTAGCGGGVNVKRLTGLSASDVVKTFIDDA